MPENRLRKVEIVATSASFDEPEQLRVEFGRQLSPADVGAYRDQWIERVRKRRHEADAIFIHRATAENVPVSPLEAPRGLAHMPSRSDLDAYIDELPNILADAYAKARAGWDSGVTADMRNATYSVIDVVEKCGCDWQRFFRSSTSAGKPLGSLCRTTFSSGMPGITLLVSHMGRVAAAQSFSS